MAMLHSKMPVILEQQDWASWLGEDAGDHLALMRPAGSGVVRVWPISRAVNSVRNNGAELMVPIEDPGPQTAAEVTIDLNPA
jgi:putative SOS response-associated peptidase YedK